MTATSCRSADCEELIIAPLRSTSGARFARECAPPTPARPRLLHPRTTGHEIGQWFLASGRPAGKLPVFPAHDGGFWDQDDWRNWRQRTWRGQPERQRRDRKTPVPARPGCAPAGTRPRDLRSSYVTLRVYEGIPLTQIGREVGTSVRMIEQHYAA